MEAATKDVTKMLDARERHDESIPLFVFWDVGGTANRATVSLSVSTAHPTRSSTRITRTTDVPDTADSRRQPGPGRIGDDVTVGVLAANVAVHVNSDVREDLAHLPAVSYWEHTPSEYVELATDAGYDADHAPGSAKQSRWKQLPGLRGQARTHHRPPSSNTRSVTSPNTSASSSARSSKPNSTPPNRTSRSAARTASPSPSSTRTPTPTASTSRPRRSSSTRFTATT